jgi:NADH-quinone oxidoreductase subunit D
MPEIKTEEMLLNMGPQHPSTHGVLRLEVRTDGEVVLEAVPHIGYLHRCFEKHAENIPFPGVVPFVDRMDYLSSMNQELGYVLAVEKLLGIRVPDRVEYIRVIMAELNRIASHLVAFGTYGLDTGAVTPFLFAFRDRERILDLFEMTCGARLLYNYIWIGGLSHDLPPYGKKKIREFLDYFEPKIKEYNDLLSYNKIFIERTANVGILPVDLAINYSITGPNLRGSGVKWDIRKDEPYSVYDRFDFDIPIGRGEHGTPGDCWDRYMVRMREIEQSVRIIRQAIEQLPDGDVHAALPRKIRPPKNGDVYVRTETPRGELGYYIVSDGEGSETAWRIKSRSPCFVVMSVFREISRGAMIADLIAILGSLDIVLGEIDR